MEACRGPILDVFPSHAPAECACMASPQEPASTGSRESPSSVITYVLDDVHAGAPKLPYLALLCSEVLRRYFCSVCTASPVQNGVRNPVTWPSASDKPVMQREQPSHRLMGS